MVKLFKFILLSACVVLAFPSVLYAQENIETFENDNSVWTVNFDTGVLEIVGSGELTGTGMTRTFMQMLTSQSLKKLVIGEGFTSVANNLFSSYPFQFTEILLPSTMTEIGRSAFSACDSIRNLVLPEGVNIVHASAFDCENLTSITIPSTITKIERMAFGRSISSVYISDLVAWCNIDFGIEVYGNPMFNWVWFEDGVTTFSEPCDLYLNGEKIVDLVIPVPNVNANAFYGCSAESVTFAPNCCNDGSVQIKIGRSAFSGMTNLKRVVIPDNAVVASASFEGCSSLEELVLGDNVSFYNYLNNDELVYTFAGCDNLKRLVIGEGIEVLGDMFGHKHSFKSNMSSNVRTTPLMLDSIVIPSTLKRIDCYILFNHREKQTKVCFKDELSWWKSPYGIREYDCYVAGKKLNNHIGDVIVPEGVEILYAGKFTDGITSVRLPQSLKAIRHDAFYNSVDLAEVNIPENVTEVGENAFVGTAWYNAQPDGMLYLDNWLLGCKGDFSGAIMDVKSGTKGIAASSFKDINALEEVLIPRSLEYIGEYAFANCGVLRYFGSALYRTDNVLNLTSGIKSVDSNAFVDCNSIEEVYFGDSLRSIGNYAFGFNSARKFVSYAETPAMLVDGSPFCQSVCDSAVLYVPEGAVGAYANIAVWSDFVYILEIGNPVITKEYNETITWSLNVETGKLSLTGSGDLDASNVSSSSWDYCAWRVNDIEIGDSIYVLNPSVFEKTKWYNELPDSIVYADGWLLGLKGDAEETVTVIDVEKCTRGIAGLAFNGNGYLREVNVPGTVEYIGNSAFKMCQALESININGVGKIAESAFRYCTSLKSVRLDSGIREIATHVFANCTSLTSLEIPASVEYIGEEAFLSCTSLKDVRLDGIREIATRAFANCTSLTSLEIPASVESIGEEAFTNCINVKKITVADGVETIQVKAFADIDSLQTITLGRDVKTIGSRAFSFTKEREIALYSNAMTPPDFVYEKRTDNVFFASTLRKEATARALITVYVPVGCKAAYEEKWTGFKEIVELETLGIDDVAGNVPSIDLIYNLRGDRLQQITTPGVYIVNGKKIFVK